MKRFEPDVRCLPGWPRVSTSDHRALLTAADSYLRQFTPKPDTWIDWAGSFAVPSADIAGFRALRLLQAESPELLATLPPAVWRKWAPVIVGYPMFSTGDEDSWQQELVAAAYQQAPEEVLAAILRRIDAESRSESPSIERLLWLLAQSWDDSIAATMLTRAGEAITPLEITGQLLAELMGRRWQPANAVACSLICRHASIDEREQSRAQIAGALLFKHAPDACWSELWTSMREHDAFGDGVLRRFVANDRYWPTVPPRLSEEQLRDLFVWQFLRYPPARTSEQEMSGFATFPMAVVQWRGSLLGELKSRGSKEACRAIEEILEALPEEEWLKSVLTEARTIMRQRTWTPPRPAEILELSRSSERRLVQNAHQLLDAVIESIRRLEEKLQLAEPPRAFELWNEVEAGRFRPKEEERLSDYIKSHLDDDLRDRGIITNREVENRRGEKTDVRVNASSHEGGLPLAVVVEVKGSWNRKLRTAISEQLAGQYLHEAQTTHGLYVVGWYNCDKWDDDDYKKRDSLKHDREETQRLLDEIAKDLSNLGKQVRAVIIDTSLRY